MPGPAPVGVLPSSERNLPMRPGPARGTTTSLEVTIDGSMTDAGSATFIASDLPPTLGTLAMADIVARVARTLLEEHLEADELAVPGRLDIIHRTPVPVGTVAQFEATVQMVEPTRVTCEVLVRTPAGVAARSSYEQEVVPRSEWLGRLDAASR
jgi:predicted thioesterase